jgi:ketosteroid isomerase-like protein
MAGMTETTNRLVDEYYARWASGDPDRLRAILTDDFQFRGPMDQAQGPDAFIEVVRRNAPAFGAVSFADVRRVVDGARAVNLYTFVAGPASVPMAEAFETRGDRIARVDLYFDPSGLQGPSGG